VDPMMRYPFFEDLLRPFRKSQTKTLALIMAAIAECGQARSFAIATVMAQWLRIRLDSAVNRFYRLLRNHRVDETLLVERWAGLLAKRTKGHLTISIDWSEWHHELRMLAAAVVVGKRAVPLWVQAFKKVVRRRSQNSRENTFIRVLADALKRAGVTATILCDRGFRRVTWLALLGKLSLDFVVRLQSDVTVELQNGTRITLDKIKLFPGKPINLGVVPLRSDGAIEVRLVGYLARGAKEPWWLATSLGGACWSILKLYDRRMTVEEQFRDTKGRRFGVKLFWTQFRDPDQLARFAMLLGVAVLIWAAAGFEAARRQPSLRLVSRTKGPRQSYVTIGIRVVASGGTAKPLTSRRLAHWQEPPNLRKVGRLRFGAAK